MRKWKLNCQGVEGAGRKETRSPCRLNKYSQNAKVELFYLVGMFRSLSQGDSISVALRKLLQRGRRGSQAIYNFVTREQAFWISKIGYQIKEFGILCMGRCKPLGSLSSFLSNAPPLSGATPVPSFTLLPAFPQLLSSHPWGWQHLHFRELSFTFGGQKSLMAVTFLVY